MAINRTELAINEKEKEENYKNFFSAVRYQNYPEMAYYLKKGVNINQQFGSFAYGSRNGLVQEGPDDTALTWAVRTAKHDLTAFLLENGADPTVTYMWNTLLMEACFMHQARMVSLLLQAGADPNKDKGEAMILIFMFREMCHVSKNEIAQIVQLLLEGGFLGKPSVIFSVLKERLCSQSTLNLFTDIWKRQAQSKAFTENATAALLAPFLYPDAGKYAGRFIDRTTAGRMVCCSKTIWEKATQAEEINRNDCYQKKWFYSNNKNESSKHEKKLNNLDANMDSTPSNMHKLS